MPVSDEDKRRFAAQVESLGLAEKDVADQYEADTPSVRTAEDDDPPELEFYRRARALGMVRIRR